MEAGGEFVAIGAAKILDETLSGAIVIVGEVAVPVTAMIVLGLGIELVSSGILAVVGRLVITDPVAGLELIVGMT